MKAVRSGCWGCKRFQAIAARIPKAGYLPTNRTTSQTLFEVVRIDFAGPIRYKKVKHESKSYLVIFACSLCRAVHLELFRNLNTGTFIPCLKRFIARRGRPQVIESLSKRRFCQHGSRQTAAGSKSRRYRWRMMASAVLV